MAMTVNVAGQVGQIRLGQQKALWPIFETVVNSIQSLEDTDCEDKKIVIEALRDPYSQYRIDANGNKVEEQSRFQDFIVTDNGNGFNEENYKSFEEAYSMLKVKKGCKGIGRFLWLKAFDNVVITSTYTEGGLWFLREFDFNLDGIKPEDNLKQLDGDNYQRSTKVMLKGFRSYYKENVSYDLEGLASKIIEHCLPYFIMKNVPEILLKDNRNKEISLNKFYETTYKDSLHQDHFMIKNEEYVLYHIMLKSGVTDHELHLCANNREVKSISLSKKIPNLEKGKKLIIEDGNVFYTGYLAGKYLDDAINVERSEFEFQDLPVFGAKSPAGEDDIVDGAVEQIKIYLSENLERIGEEKRRQIDKLVQSRHPQYRFLLNKKPEVYDQIPSGLTDEKLDIELYKHQQVWELEAVQQRQKIEQKEKDNATTDEAYGELFDSYCENVSELNRASLAEYVIHRKAVIDLFSKAIEANDDGKFSKEERIHKIICPMQKSSDEIPYDSMNLWLIDDRLAYHHFLASDQKMNTIPMLKNNNDKRMDLAVFDAALSYTEDSENISSITIVELKRPMRNDRDNDPVWQVKKYVMDIKAGKIKKANGRDFENMDHVSFYCYVIGDLTPSMRESAERGELLQTQDRQGYFGYSKNCGAYIEVISYDKLLKDAKQRNRILFDKLLEPKAKNLKHPEMVGK